MGVDWLNIVKSYERRRVPYEYNGKKKIENNKKSIDYTIKKFLLRFAIRANNGFVAKLEKIFAIFLTDEENV